MLATADHLFCFPDCCFSGLKKTAHITRQRSSREIDDGVIHLGAYPCRPPISKVTRRNRARADFIFVRKCKPLSGSSGIRQKFVICDRQTHTVYTIVTLKKS